MYALHKQIHVPTGIEHSIYCNFYNTQQKNLVVAGANLLRIFRLIPESENDCSRMKLECTQTFSLYGHVVSLQSVRFTGSCRDALVLSFKDAKLSVVEYDPRTHDLRTLSLHYFEDDNVKGGRMNIFELPIVRVDPANRCAAMLIYGQEIVIVPFRKESGTDNVDSTASSGRAPVLASYTVNMRELDEKMSHIIDLQFLFGYYEPTLLVLYEPIRTWPGRIAVRQDTCAMVAVSINIQQKVHPVIWSLDNLPFDCTQVLPVPKPIGGVLIFAVNSLLYLNQSVPPYGVSLNSLSDESTSFPLKPQEDIKISLDCAQATFISSDRVVISLKNGELYVLMLLTDGMRSVRAFNIDKAAASVLTTCMTVCEKNFLFLGSRLGNSLLLHYTEKINQDAAESKSIEKSDDESNSVEKSDDESKSVEKSDEKIEPPSKKKRLDTLGDWMASNVTEIQDPEELEVYGTVKQTTTQITQYSFEICDSLINIGPLGNVSMGEPAFLSEEYSGSIDPDVELVSTSGYGKNGALCVLQRTIRPQVVTTFELPSCTDMWTVVGPKASISEKTSEVPPDDEDSEDKTNGKSSNEKFENSHAFLIISRTDNTMILQTGQEINELDHSGFSTQSKTVFAGNLGDNNQYIVQVSPTGVRLLDGVNQLQHIPLDVGSPIVHASVANPYLVILSEEGAMMVLTLHEGGKTSLRSKAMTAARLTLSKPQIRNVSKLVTLCSYRDVSGLFSTKTSDLHSSHSVESNDSVFGMDHQRLSVDEDDLLYSSEVPVINPVKKEFQSKTSMKIKFNSPTHWVLAAYENGDLEIFSLPNINLVYAVKNFHYGHKVLVDNAQQPFSSASTAEKKPEATLILKEILLVGLGHADTRPILLARVNEEIMLYEVFPFHDSPVKDHLSIRFAKISHGMITHDRKSHRSRKRTEDTSCENDKLRFRYFQDIAGYSGVFICGSYPHWLFMTSHGELRFHPMPIDGNIPVFAPFHNVNCVKGFLYFNKSEELRICVLPTHLSYDSPWPVRKVPLRCTPHFVSYHVESKTYCVVTSTMDICDRVVKHVAEEKEFETVEKDDRFMYPNIDKFSIQLFSPVSWDVIPNTRIDLEEWEHVTVMKTVPLVSEGTMSGLKGYVAVGTNFNYGEDVTSRGKIMIYDIIEVVPEPGQPLTKNKVKTVYCKEQKGPVTSLCHVQGFLLSCIGQKIYVWQLKDNDLVGIAFIDTQIYIHSVVSIKNLVIVADIFKSVTLLCYQEESRTLAQISREIKPIEVYSVEYFVDNNQLGFLVADVDKNVVLYSYQPEARESYGGQRLLRKGDIHIGSSINSFFRIRCKLSHLQNEKKALMMAERRHVTMYATQDGSMGYIVPVSEKTYRRLLMLQNLLITNIPHTAGLNPKAFRLYNSHRRQLVNPHKNILDGDLLWRFINLPVAHKMELAKKIGTQVAMIYDDLLEIDRCTAHF